MLSRKPFPFTMEDFFLEGKRKKKAITVFFISRMRKSPSIRTRKIIGICGSALKEKAVGGDGRGTKHCLAV